MIFLYDYRKISLIADDPVYTLPTVYLAFEFCSLALLALFLLLLSIPSPASAARSSLRKTPILPLRVHTRTPNKALLALKMPVQ